MKEQEKKEDENRKAERELLGIKGEMKTYQLVFWKFENGSQGFSFIEDDYAWPVVLEAMTRTLMDIYDTQIEFEQYLGRITIPIEAIDNCKHLIKAKTWKGNYYGETGERDFYYFDGTINPDYMKSNLIETLFGVKML